MNEQLLLKNIAEIGRLLLKNGAEIYRVEESLERMCQSYGFKDIGVFALPTYFTISVTFKDNTSASYTKRTLQNRTNLDAVCALNDLVRKICLEKPNNEFIQQQIDEINHMNPIMPLVFLGYGLGAGGYALFFGGGLKEGIIAAIIGFLMYFFIWINEILNINALIRTTFTSMFLTALSILFYHFKMISNLDATIIGCLMILTPGIAITNSLRDIIDGNYVSGQARLVEAFFIATAIALGVGLMRILMKGMI